jgi:transposase
VGGGVLIQITPQLRILVAVEPGDARKGIDSLAQLCREKPDAGPFSGCLFIFRSRSAKAIRILACDGQGFRIATKRLAKGRFKRWPTGAEPAQTLQAHQAQLLLAADNPDAEAAPVWRRVSAQKIFASGACVPLPVPAHRFPGCQPNGDTGAERSQRKTSYSFRRSSRHTPTGAGADCRRSFARRGSGSRPTARCAAWSAGALC